MKKLKDLYRKLVDKIFGKRCECLIKKKRNGNNYNMCYMWKGVK